MPGESSLRRYCQKLYSQYPRVGQSRCYKESAVRARPVYKVTYSSRPGNLEAEEPEHRWGVCHCGEKHWLGPARNLLGWARTGLTGSSATPRLVEVDFGSVGSTSVRIRRQRRRSRKRRSKRLESQTSTDCELQPIFCLQARGRHVMPLPRRKPRLREQRAVSILDRSKPLAQRKPNTTRKECRPSCEQYSHESG